MNGRELRDALRAAATEDPAARERSWRVVRAAYAGYAPRRRRRPWPALVAAVALSVVVAAGAAAAAAPRSDVGRWVRDVLGAGEPGARPVLARLPGGGRLLVRAGDSAWVVAPDGSKRRLGAYDGASWSPHGRFVVAWRGHELAALDPRGRVRWSLARSREPVTAARWAPVDGFRIAYLAGSALRVVNGDGTGDRRHGTRRRPRGAGLAPRRGPRAGVRRPARAHRGRRGRRGAAAVAERPGGGRPRARLGAGRPPAARRRAPPPAGARSRRRAGRRAPAAAGRGARARALGAAAGRRSPSCAGARRAGAASSCSCVPPAAASASACSSAGLGASARSPGRPTAARSCSPTRGRTSGCSSTRARPTASAPWPASRASSAPAPAPPAFPRSVEWCCAGRVSP